MQIVFFIFCFLCIFCQSEAREIKLTSEEAVVSDAMGQDVVLNGKTAAVGIPSDDNQQGQDAGAILIFVHRQTGWIQQAKIVPKDINSVDEFGSTLAMSGNTLVVGVPKHNSVGEKAGATYIFVRKGEEWHQQAKLTGNDTEAKDQFGRDVAIDGNRVIVGTPLCNTPFPDGGAAYIFERKGQTWTQMAKLSSSDIAGFDWFGLTVALKENLAVVGAIREDGRLVSSDAGAAYIFRYTEGIWIEEAKIIGHNTKAKDNFGSVIVTNGKDVVIGVPSSGNSGGVYFFEKLEEGWKQTGNFRHFHLKPKDLKNVSNFGSALSMDGNYIAIGATGFKAGDNTIGATDLYMKRMDTWIFRQRLTANDGKNGDNFGASVALSGKTVLVGAPRHSAAGGDGSGAAYVFQPRGTNWVQQSKLVDPISALEDEFGYSVAVSDETAVVGARQDDKRGLNSGTVYVFMRQAPTAKTLEEWWKQTAVLTAEDPAIGAQFGHAVDIDQDTIIVGAYGADVAGSDSGTAYIFERRGAQWDQQARLVAKDAKAGDLFGSIVAIHGQTAIVGAYGVNSQQGAAYVFVQSGGSWLQQAKLQPPDAALGDKFGGAVSIYNDTIVVGAREHDASGTNTGAAYVFVRQGDRWIQQAKLLADDATIGDQFGVSVSVDEETIVAGAWLDDNAVPDTGSAYIFIRTGGNWSKQAKIVAVDAAIGDHLGQTVAVVGNTVILGAPGDDIPPDPGPADEGPTFDVGAVYTYTRVGLFWTARGKRMSGDAGAYDQFGSDIGLSDETIIVGVRGDDSAGNDAGAAYIYNYSDAGLVFDPQLSVDPGSKNRMSTLAEIKQGQFLTRPEQTQSFPNYPNPFNPETWIPFQLAEPSAIVVEIYDVSGQKVRSLKVGHRQVGFYTSQTDAIYWDGRNYLGEGMPSGIYYYRFISDRYDGMRKMMILR